MATDLMIKKLGELKTTKQPVAIYLVSSVQITGEVIDYDDTDVLVSSPGSGWCLVSRSAIATLKPHVKKKEA
jgi:sRNA-binding regulator protein Hfq